MKKQIFAAVAALCLMATTSLSAQESKPQARPKTPPTAEQIARHQTDRMAERLNLTEEQSKQVYEVNLAQVKRMQAMRKEMREARKAEADKMKSILTTEQFMQWSQMQGPRPGLQGKAPHHMKGKKGPKHGDCPKDCPRKDCPSRK